MFLNLNDSDDYYEIILHSAIEVIENANKGSLLVLNQKDNLYEYHTCVGYDLAELKKVKMELEETFLYKNANNNFEAPAIIRNIKEFDTKILDESRVTFIENAGGLDIEEVLSAPIVIDGKIFAILNIDSDRKDAFDEIDLQLIHFFSSQISTRSWIPARVTLVFRCAKSFKKSGTRIRPTLSTSTSTAPERKKRLKLRVSAWPSGS